MFPISLLFKNKLHVHIFILITFALRRRQDLHYYAQQYSDRQHRYSDIELSGIYQKRRRNAFLPPSLHPSRGNRREARSQKPNKQPLESPPFKQVKPASLYRAYVAITTINNTLKFKTLK